MGRSLPIMDNGRLIGISSSRDILENIKADINAESVQLFDKMKDLL